MSAADVRPRSAPISTARASFNEAAARVPRMEPARKRLGRHANRRRPRELPAEEGPAAPSSCPARPSRCQTTSCSTTGSCVRERCRARRRHRSARGTAGAAAAPAVSRSYHNRGPFRRLERLAQALHPRIELFHRPEVEDQHVVVAAVDRLLPPCSGSRFDRFGSGEVHEFADADPECPANLRHA